MQAIFGKVKGKGNRHQCCPSCGKAIDLHLDRCWLGDGGWYCDPCGKAMRDPIRVRKAGRARVYHNKKNPVRFGQLFMEEGGKDEDEHSA